MVCITDAGVMYKKYEKLTKQIVEEVKKVTPTLQNAVIGHGTKNKIEGGSGFKHQIDVSIEIPNKKLILVECKRYKSKVTLSDMLILVARIDDINKKSKLNVTGIFFTTVGYTAPARKIGSQYNIELNIAKNIKQFAVQVGGNVLVKAAPIRIRSRVKK